MCLKRVAGGERDSKLCWAEILITNLQILAWEPSALEQRLPGMPLLRLPSENSIVRPSRDFNSEGRCQPRAVKYSDWEVAMQLWQSISDF